MTKNTHLLRFYDLSPCQRKRRKNTAVYLNRALCGIFNFYIWPRNFIRGPSLPSIILAPEPDAASPRKFRRSCFRQSLLFVAISGKVSRRLPNRTRNSSVSLPACHFFLQVQELGQGAAAKTTEPPARSLAPSCWLTAATLRYYNYDRQGWKRIQHDIAGRPTLAHSFTRPVA